MQVSSPGWLFVVRATPRVTILLIAVMTFANTLAAIALIHDILVSTSDVTATVLLGRGAVIWVTNVDRLQPLVLGARSRWPR
jgi:hypothetical protein